jgi:hypothetical protein
MSDFSIRADSVNVEEIMRQIRARVREKRGVDYTEQQIQELAAVKLERFLDPEKVRSELLQHFRPAPAAPNYQFEDQTLFATHRRLLRLVRRILRPFLKLFFNPDPLIQALHIQSGLNAHIDTRLSQHTELSYELLHNLVVEMTRLGIEVKNLKMRVESLSSRLDFHERRARALEGVVQYRPAAGAPPAPAQAGTASAGPATAAREGEGLAADARNRRRRRRRGRRGAQGTQPADLQDRSATPPDAPAGGEPHRDEPGVEPRDPGPGDDSGSGSSGQ